jgi:D-cysteine desulfhydrase
LERVPRLGIRIGLGADDLWVKRDDLLAVGGGGNKLRKLDRLCVAALGEGATTLVAYGAPQSNFCRLAAAAARRLSLGVILVLAGEGGGGRTGNLTLDALFGAEVKWAGDADRDRLEAAAREVVAELRERSERPALLPFGGSCAVSARGYVAAAEEIIEQAGEFERLVVAVGSGATMAGLVAGLGAERVLGVDTGAVADPYETVAAIVSQLWLEGASATKPDEPLRIDRSQGGPGYEAMTDAAREAMLTAGECEGLILDPVYTAKAFAGLTAAVRAGEIERGRRTVFLHTGGLPGLFGHPVAAEFAAAADGFRR